MTCLKIVLTLFFYGYCNAGLVIPPLPDQAALMARYIMHNSDWVSIATISTQESIKGYPFVGLKSLSDGTVANSTGIPYLYMTDMDVSGHDLVTDNRVTIMATLAQSEYCQTEDLDPQDPRCAKTIITGKYIKINQTNPEYEEGKNFLFERHPVMKTWPEDHSFYVAKIDPEQIDVLDYFGGIKHVTKEEYFSANLTNKINAIDEFNRISVVEIGVN